MLIDETGDAAAKGVEGLEDTELPNLSADDEVAIYHGQAPGFFGQWAKAAWENKTSNLVLLAMAVAGFLLHRKWLLYLSLAGLLVQLLLFPLLSAWFGRTMRLYSRLNHAKVWGRWNEVLEIAEKLRRAQKLTGIGVGKVEIARNRALAWAALGNLEQAVREFSRFEGSKGMPRWLYLSHLAGIHDEAQEFGRALELKSEATTENPDNGSLWVDHAFALVRRLNRPEEAQQSLARAEAADLPELGLPYLDLIRGLISWRKNDPGTALNHFRNAETGYQKFQHHDLVEGLSLLTRSHQCLMHCLLGETAAAAKLFRQTEAFLVGNREEELLAACRNILKQSPPAHLIS